MISWQAVNGLPPERRLCRVPRGLLAAFLKGKKLVAQVDESSVLAPAAQREFEQAPVEGQSLLDVAHLERDVFNPTARALLVLGMAVVSRCLW
jgi:hypothetical protein